MAIDLTALANDLWPLLQSKVADSARAATSTSTIYASDPNAAPKTAEYLTLSTDGTLLGERVFTSGSGLSAIDTGANGTYSLSLTTPGSLSVSSANAAAGNHTHAIASSSNPGLTASILASAPTTGLLTLQKLTTRDSVIIADDIANGSSSPLLTLGQPVSVSGAQKYGIQLYQRVDDLSASQGYYAVIGGVVNASTPPSAPGFVSGGQFEATTETNIGTVQGFSGVANVTADTGSVNVSDMLRGGYFSIGTYGLAPKTINKAYGVWSRSEFTGGATTISDHRGFFIESGALPTVTNHYGLYISAPTGTITNKYSIYIEDSGSYGIYSSNDLLIGAGSNLVKLPTTNFFQSPNFASQTTGWRIGGLGEADFRYIYTDELHAKKFIADLEQALAGLQIIAKSVAMLGAPFTAPAPGGSATITLKDLPSAENMAVFEAADFILVRSFSRAGGGLSITNCWGTVTNYTDEPDPNLKLQHWTFTRSTGADAGAMAAGAVVGVDTIIVDFGTSLGGGVGGYYEVNAIDGIYGLNSPYMQIVKWTGHPNSGKVVTMRAGNLRGITGNTDEYGLYTGDGYSAANKYIRASTLGVFLNNIDLKLHSGGIQTVNIDSAGTNIWVGPSTSDKRLQWDGTRLIVRGSVLVGPGVSYGVSPLLYLGFGVPPHDTHVNTNGHRGQKPSVIAGSIRGETTPYGGAFVASEAHNNYVKNPSFEVDLVDWAGTQNGSSSFTRQTIQSFYGAGSMQILRSGGTVCYAANSATAVTVGQFLTASAHCMQLAGTSGNCVLGAFIYNSIGAVIAQPTVAFTTGPHTWERKFVGFQIPAGGVSVSVYLDCSAMGNGYAYFDGVMLDANVTWLHPYVDGTLPGHTWSGTAHNSVSSRTHSDLRFAEAGNINWGRGTIWARFFPAESTSTAGNTGYRVILHSVTGSEFVLLRINPAQALEGYWGTTGISGGAVSVHTWHSAAMTFDGTTVRLYLDGVEVASGAGAPLGASHGDLAIGSYGPTEQALNGYIAELAVLDEVLTADQVLSAHSSNQKLTITHSNYELMLTDRNAGKVTAHAGGIFGENVIGKPNFTLLNADATVNGELMGEGDAMFGDNSSGKANQLWDNSDSSICLRVGTSDVLKVKPTAMGDASIEGVLNLGTAGGVWVGPGGDFDNPANGLRILPQLGYGLIEVWYNSSPSVSIGTSFGGGVYGMMLGTGQVQMSRDRGITILADTTSATDRSVNFKDTFLNRIGELSGFSTSAVNQLFLNSYANSATKIAKTFIMANQAGNNNAEATLWAAKELNSAPFAYTHVLSSQPLNKGIFTARVESTTEVAYIECNVTGTTSAITISADSFTSTAPKEFKIDHPIHPLSMWLRHAAIESDDRRNVYTGTVTLDENGEAVVTMPEWFWPISKKPRYALTCVGEFAPVYVIESLPKSQLSLFSFKIKGGIPGLRVDWHMTTVRDDRYARKMPYVVEETKANDERGYLAAWRQHGRSERYSLAGTKRVLVPAELNMREGEK